MKLGDWISLICFLLALFILWQFRQILLMVFAAVVIAIALNSLVRRIMRVLKIPRNQALLVALSLVFTVGLLFFLLVFPLFADQFEQLLQLVPQGVSKFDVWLRQRAANPPTWFPESITLGEFPALADILRQFSTLGTQFFSNFFTIFSGSINTALQLLLLLVLTVMFLADPDAYRHLFLRLFPSAYRRRTNEILAKCETSLLSWLGGVSVNSLFVSTLSFIGLVTLGVPYAFANAMLAGVFNFIPNIGPALSAIFPIIVAMSKSFSSAISVLILYVIIQNLESYWFSPMMMRKQVSLLPAATLIAQLFFATFFGLPGLILALPLAVVCKTWIEEAWIVDVLEHGDRSLSSEVPALALEAAPPSPEPET